MGKAAGYCGGKGGSMHIAAVDMGMLGATGIVGSAMPIAVGAALTAKTLHRDTVTVCFHGDGATNQGVWHESINLAAAWNLPVIFLCENNQWAISLPYDQAAKNPQVSDRAKGYGIPGVTVDGFNPFAVHVAVHEAAERARRGEGPTLIEAKFYRYIGHFVADDERYRDTSCNELWKEFDPLTRMGTYLVESGTATEEWIKAADEAAAATVADAIEFAKAAPEPEPETLYTGMYSPEFMAAQGIEL
jgi:pyruvate dehydrogenase E1 component alpha subunit